MAAEAAPVAATATATDPSTAHSAEQTSPNGVVSNGVIHDEEAASAAAVMDEDAQPFEVALRLPARPLLPANAAAEGLPEVPSPLRVAVTAQETLNDLRLTITDSPEGYWLGAFCFRRPANAQTKANGKVSGDDAEAKLGERLGEWIEMKEIFRDVPKEDRELYVAHVPFNEADARAHVQRLRELLSSGQADPTSLGLDGGISVDTLEGEKLFITSTTQGFYINRSTSFTFDPSPREEHFASASLFDVLCGFSKSFLSNFSKLFKDPVSQRDYFAVVPLSNCLPAHPWLARSNPHHADLLRSQAAYLLTGAVSADTLDGTRDWNDELQSTRELPRATLSERLVRDRVLNRAYAEFTLAAVKAVPRVALGEVQAMNPMDKPDARMYLHNNLFLSKGADGVDIYTHLGGDEAAHVAVSKDLAGIRALNQLDLDGLCLLGTVVVDWKGERWVAQSVVPGLFRRRDDDEALLAEGQESGTAPPPAPKATSDSSKPASASRIDPKEDTQVVYGGVEGPEIIRTDPVFHKVFGKIARTLHLAEHKVPDAEQQSKSLWLSVDSKGLRGADGRKYALDLARLSPLDVEWLERDYEGAVIADDAAEIDGATQTYPHRMTLLRQELLEVFYHSEFRKWAKEQVAARGDSEDKSSTEETDAAPQIDASEFKLAFNPDAFVEFKLPETEGAAKVEAPSAADGSVQTLITDESEASVAAVRAASRYLRDTAIPRLVTDVASGLYAAQDGTTLTRQMHSRGINVRYLGYVAHLCHPTQRNRLDQSLLSKAGPGHEGFLKAFASIVTQEMVVRGAKRVLRALLKPLPADQAPSAISHFLNCLLGAALESNPRAVWQKSPFHVAADAPPAWLEITSHSVVADVRAEVRRRYRYELAANFFEANFRKGQALRELSQRCGFQLKLQEYNFERADKPLVNGHANGASEDSQTEAVTSPAATGSAPSGKKKKKGTLPETQVVPGFTPARRGPKLTTFEPEDILHLLPVVKDSTPKSVLAEEAFEAGRVSISRGDINLGVDLLIEGIGFHEQVYGLVHPEVARCYSLFATIVHHFASLQAVEHDQRVRQAVAEGKEAPAAPETNEHLTLENAVRYQRQAVTLSERTLGLDHPETLTHWQNLSVLERAEGNTEASLRCQQRVLELYNLVYGPNHPDTVNVLNNIAMTLQAARLFEPSLKIYTAAHELALKLHGSESIHTANLAHELSQAYTLCGDLKNALNVEKEACRVFEARLGKEDSQTKESEQFLQSLTTSAVRFAKMEKEREAAALSSGRGAVRRGNALGGSLLANGASRQATVAGGSAQRLSTNSVVNAAAGAPPSTAPSGAVPSTSSIDDIVAFIQGGSSSAKGKAKSTGGAMKRNRK
ncbi:protein tif31 [Ceraceosorus bombacis]|uniref:Clustered mitochondria protein homolog n=1 Tax=Ceraceosorus bombacis TaxID=401625 RepID=A0A0P1B9F8_9BASI|nr:protein tif31 [Ceraceosorus bombacis]